jgi:RNA polymerase sigma-70 factor (family 1)
MKINSKKKSLYDKLPDLYLFQQIGEGKQEAMELFFEKYYKKLCRFGFSYEPNISLIEEKVADIFIELWNNRKTLSKINNPKSYIYVIAKNSFKKVNKFERFHQQIDEKKQSFNMSIPSREEEIIDSEQKDINTNLIYEILDFIPKKSRHVFELSRIEGLKYKEISEILSISPKTVENHIGIALKCIRKTLLSYKTEATINEIH